TMEANPGTITADNLTRIVEVGINRISLGMQSAHPDELALLERRHNFFDVVNAVEWARAAGINNLNLDLIFGLPGQEVDVWMASLDAAISLKPEHLSLYALSLEHGTPLQHKVEGGTLVEPDADLAADMYEASRERLRKEGYTHYEISNWAREEAGEKNYACKHNLQYWRTLPYIGVGAGAHGFCNQYRTVNVAHPAAYIKKFRDYSKLLVIKSKYPSTPATIQANLIDQNTEIGEMMMMGLRLVQEGISNQEFMQRFGLSLQEIFGKQIDRLIGFGLLEWYRTINDNLRLTGRGQLLGNQVFSAFI
ncbi:MAG TPA: radical SAM family heme chaperone HemW, partial [Anaerolineales bacterium]|nr:radical SAM family heme chaperone HemW [Anaerolineales bacterium]